MLGLIEGEGSFCLNDPKNMGISFNLALTSTQAPLMLAIKNFLDTYHIEDDLLKTSPDFLEIAGKRTSMHSKLKSTDSGKGSLEIQIRQLNYIVSVFIPMLSNLSFVTKKHEDFLD